MLYFGKYKNLLVKKKILKNIFQVFYEKFEVFGTHPNAVEYQYFVHTYTHIALVYVCVSVRYISKSAYTLHFEEGRKTTL